MALFRPSLGTLNGSIADNVFARNAGGDYVRRRTIPTNPGTAFQQVVRQHMAYLNDRWQQTLTPTQRSAWEAYAESVQVVNRLGEAITLSGLNHFVRSNVPRLQSALSQVDDGPTIHTLPSFTSPTMTVDAPLDEASIVFINTDDWANEDGAAMLWSFSRPQGQAINYFKGPYRYAGKIDGNGTTPPTSPAVISLPFPIEPGQKVFGFCRVSRADGRLSQSFRGFDVA